PADGDTRHGGGRGVRARRALEILGSLSMVGDGPVFAGLINHAKAAASHVVFMYLARASVAIPFVIALGFALAAITAMLVDRFGHVATYWMVAGGLAGIGIIAALVVSSKEHEHEVAEKVAEQTNTQEAISDATAQALLQTPIALLGALFATP